MKMNANKLHLSSNVTVAANTTTKKCNLKESCSEKEAFLDTEMHILMFLTSIGSSKEVAPAHPRGYLRRCLELKCSLVCSNIALYRFSSGKEFIMVGSQEQL